MRYRVVTIRSVETMREVVAHSARDAVRLSKTKRPSRRAMRQVVHAVYIKNDIRPTYTEKGTMTTENIYHAAQSEYDALKASHDELEAAARAAREQMNQCSQKILNAYQLLAVAFKPGDKVRRFDNELLVVTRLTCYGRDVYAVVSRWLPKQQRAAHNQFFQVQINSLELVESKHRDQVAEVVS